MTSFKKKQDISVLIIAYRRFNNVQKISQLCLEAGITNFFFHIDVPKSDQISALADNQQVLETINKFDKTNSVNCRKLIATANKGCAVSVISALESNFWSAGARRAFHGYLDAWDLLIGNFLIRNKSYSLLPQENLILNIGNDVVAEHVEAKSIWTQVPVSEKNFIPLLPEFNSECDDWLKRNFYQIRLRHFFSTKLNLILDLMIGARRKYPKNIKARLLFK